MSLPVSLRHIANEGVEIIYQGPLRKAQARLFD